VLSPNPLLVTHRLPCFSNDHRVAERWGAVSNPVHLGEKVSMDDQHGCPAVGQVVTVVIRRGQGIHGHGNGPDSHGPEKDRDELGAIREEKHDALFHLDPEGQEGMGDPRHLLRQLAIANLPVSKADGDPLPPPRPQMVVEEAGRHVERLRRFKESAHDFGQHSPFCPYPSRRGLIGKCTELLASFAVIFYLTRILIK